MKIVLRMVWRELRNNQRFALFFAINLAAGLVGLITVESLRIALVDSLNVRSRQILGGDLSVSGRRPLTDDERNKVSERLGAEALSTRILDSMSMVAGGGTSRLAQIRAVDGEYPWYGDIKLKQSGAVAAGAGAKLQDRPLAWVDESLANELKLAIGQTLVLGGQAFEIADFLVEDSTNGFSSFNVAQRVYVGRPWFERTSLMQKGSTAFYALLYKLPPDANGTDIEKTLNQDLPDPGIRVRTHQRASEESARLFGYLSDYLGLVSLTALLLASLGAVFQFRRFFLSRSHSVAILLSLGATHRQALTVFLVELVVLGSLASVLALLASAIVLPLFSTFLARFSPVTLSLVLHPQAMVAGLVFGLGGSLLLCAPQLRALSGFSASALFRDEIRVGFDSRKSDWLWYLPALVGFAALSVFLAKSFLVGAAFIGGIAGSVVAIVAVTAIAMRWEGPAPLLFRLARRHLQRSRATTWLAAVTIGLSAMLVSLIPQVRSGLERDIENPAEGARPSLFLFDIQDEQLEPLKAIVQERGVKLQQLSPFIRARLMSVNGKSFEKDPAQEGFKTRESERDSGFRNRGFNLSFRAGITESEEITEGRPFAGGWDAASGKLPEISVERRFAERLGWKLNDELEFDIQGVAISAKVVNLRRVRWASFQPNFFVVFQPGVLEETPKTYLAAVPALGDGARRDLQNALVEKLPNVSAVDVGKVIERLLQLSSQLSLALQLMAAWTALAGFLTLYSMARYEAYSRRWEMNLLKVLGGGAREVAGIFLIEAALVAGIASSVGALSSLGVSALLSYFVFESPWGADFPMALFTIVGTVALSLILTALAAAKVWNEKPLALLSHRA